MVVNSLTPFVIMSLFAPNFSTAVSSAANSSATVSSAVNSSAGVSTKATTT